MRLIQTIDELLALKGRNLAFFYGAKLPAPFSYFEFIRRSQAAIAFDHLIICPNIDATETDLKELRHRLRMMDLVKDTPKDTSEIYGFSLELCHGSKNELTFDDMLHILKRRGKKIYVLLPCHSEEAYTKHFKTTGINFVYACSKKQKQVKANNKHKNSKFIYMGDIRSCHTEPVYNSRDNKGAYVTKEVDKYLAEHHLYQNDQAKKTFN
jgi:hypothetical protein